jgi:hypothetical protein
VFSSLFQLATLSRTFAPAPVESENCVSSTQDVRGLLPLPSTVSGGVGSGGFLLQPVIAITVISKMETENLNFIISP